MVPLKKRKNKAKEQGFTLIELLVVLAIIGILAVLILSNLATARAKARDATRKSDLKAMSDALELYSEDHQYKYPISGVGATPVPVVPVSQATAVSTAIYTELLSASNKYMRKVPEDPRGQTYYYLSDGNTYEFWVKLEAATTDAWFVASGDFNNIVIPTGTPPSFGSYGY